MERPLDEGHIAQGLTEPPCVGIAFRSAALPCQQHDREIGRDTGAAGLDQLDPETRAGG